MPSLRIAARCRSIGRRPISQPPGAVITASPVALTNAPRKIIDERISRISTSSIEFKDIRLLSTDTVPTLRCTSQPRERRIFKVASMSLKSGQLCITHGVPTATVAAKIGNALFFAPCIRTLPQRLFPPSIMYCPIKSPFRKISICCQFMIFPKKCYLF